MAMFHVCCVQQFRRRIVREWCSEFDWVGSRWKPNLTRVVLQTDRLTSCHTDTSARHEAGHRTYLSMLHCYIYTLCRKLAPFRAL